MRSTVTPIESGHIRSLDGIRGLAVLMVFLYHALSYELLIDSVPVSLVHKVAVYGWAGVDAFFVLSGFLITTILLDARGASNYFKVFYARRGLRIAPLYYLVVAATLLSFHGSHAGWAQAWYWLNLSNLPTAFDPLLILLLAHLWSLAIEEQFYLAWPTLVRFMRVRRLAWLCVAVIAGVFLARNLPYTLHMNARYPEFVYRLTPYRIDTLCGGALLAIIAKYRPGWIARNQAVLWGLLVLGFGVFLSRGGDYQARSMIRIGYSSLMLGCCALVALCILPGTLPARCFGNAALVRLGKYSYAFYLFHAVLVREVVIHMAALRRGMPFLHSSNAATFFLLPFEFAVVFAASAASWHFFEGPILKAKRHFRYTPRPERILA